MKQTNSFSNVALAFMLTLTGVATSCADRDVYDPNANKNKLPAPETFFGFEMRGDMQLSVDYNAPGFKTIIEVYDQNPMQKNGVSKKEGILPVFTAYTDANGKFEGEMKIPAIVKEAYVYTDRWGLPLCVELEATADGWKYDAAQAEKSNKKSAATRAAAVYDYLLGDEPPYKLKGHDAENLYSLVYFDKFGYVGNQFFTRTSTYKNENLGEISNRAQAYFDTYTGKRTELLKPADITNIKMAKDGSLDLIFMDERAEYLNSFGYYYYEAGNAPKTDAELKAIRKYVIIPDVEKESSAVATGYTFRLKYFGKSGTDKGTDTFPKNTVIGWFVVSNGWNTQSNTVSNWDGVMRNFFLSNDQDENMRFVAVKDQKTGLVVLGCEDQPERLFDREKEDYSDILFFVKSDDGELDDAGKPEIPGEKPVDKNGTTTVSGTLAYEDIWPNGGDYDLNDVVVEYERVIDYDGNNKAIAITETFTPVQKAGSANHENFFAYQVKGGLGNVGALPADCLVETATNSIVINKSAKTIKDEVFVIKRDVKSLGLAVNDVIADFNPYIIVGGYKDSKRIEVHLPKHEATSAADISKVGAADDAYFINKKGDFPFAVDIPVWGFKVATERSRIDSAAEYPEFAKWANSKGTEYKDWYLMGKGTPTE